MEYATGEEARIRYAQFLKRIGRDDECRALCEETLRRTRLGGKVYQKAQSEWIQEAKRLSDSF